MKNLPCHVLPDNVQMLSSAETTMAVVHELGNPLLGFEKFSSDEVDLVSALYTGYDTAKIIVLGFSCTPYALCGYRKFCPWKRFSSSSTHPAAGFRRQMLQTFLESSALWLSTGNAAATLMSGLALKTKVCI